MRNEMCLKSRLLVAAIVLQLMIITGGFINAAYPLWTGQEVRLKAVPYDPRSMFRGDYAYLRYDLPRRASSDKRGPGGWVYVPLKQRGKIWAPGELSATRPDEGVFIRGRTGMSGEIRYGIEAWFLPREKARAVDEGLRRRGGVATVSIAPNGQAALVGVEPG